MTLIVFIAAMAFVFIFAWMKSRGVNKESKDGFFLGGRSLTAGVIAVGLLLNNMSATHFVGYTGDTWWGNLTTIGYEITSAVALVIAGLFLVPRYLKQGITTIPDFLEQRYNSSTKRLATLIVIFAYLANMLPITLYSGSVVLVNIFGIDKVMGISYEAAIIGCCVLIGIIGSVYALYGGLKMVATADIMNGVLLVLGGALVVFFGFKYLGDGHILNGVKAIIVNNPEKLNSIGTATDIVPFNTTFTGLALLVMYFWGTDQSIIQRALAAKNLKHGQKGVMIAGLYKCFSPIMVMVPGLIAFQVFKATGLNETITNRDLVYPMLVNMTLPTALQGIFVAAMFGAVLSTFCGLLNSTTTLLALNVITPIKKRELSGEEMVTIGKRFGIIIAVFAMIIAPMLMFTPSGLFTYLQMINGFTNIPILIMVGVGYLNKKAPAFAAKIAGIGYAAAYGISFLVVPKVNYLHRIGVLFVIAVLFMLIMGKVKPVKKEFVLKNSHAVNMKPWKYRYGFSAVLVSIMVDIYLLFSSLGLAGENGFTASTLMWLIVGAAVSTALVYLFKTIFKGREDAFYKDCDTTDDEVPDEFPSGNAIKTLN